MNKILRVLFVAAVVLTMGSCKESGGGSGTAACGSDECKLTASDAVFGDTFGFASAIDGDELLIGAENNNAVGVGSGAVYAYRRVGSEYEEVQKIVPAGLAAGDAFGSAIAIDGDCDADGQCVAVIGARLAKGGNGSAYVFRLVAGQWVEEQELEANLDERVLGQGPVKGQFGRAVAVSGDWIAVGAPRDNFFDFIPAFTRLKMGTVSMFKYTETDGDEPWKFDPVSGYLFPNRVPPGELFGTSVALDGTVLAVGAVGDSTVGSITIIEGGNYRVGSSSFFTVVLDCVGCDGNFSARHVVDPPRDAQGNLILDPDGLPARRGPMTGVEIIDGGNGGSSLPEVQFPAVFGSGSGATGRVNLDTSGAAFVYSLDATTGTWTQDTKLKALRKGLECEVEPVRGLPFCVPPLGGQPTPISELCNDGFGGDNFGISVAVLGDLVVVGADKKERRRPRTLGCGFVRTANERQNGGAYFYRAGVGRSWDFEAIIEPADPNAKKFFGGSISIDTDVIAVGARGDGDSAKNSGAIYIYRLEGAVWDLDTKIHASDGQQEDNFGVSVGISVGIDGERVVVGAWKHNDSGPQSGAAYGFDL